VLVVGAAVVVEVVVVVTVGVSFIVAIPVPELMAVSS
jgi:hypothetical protein